MKTLLFTIFLLSTPALASKAPSSYLTLDNAALFKVAVGGIGRCVMAQNKYGIYTHYAVMINGQQISGTTSEWTDVVNALRVLIGNQSCNFRGTTFSHQKYLRMDNATLWNAGLRGVGNCSMIVNTPNLAVGLYGHQIGATESNTTIAVNQLRKFIGAGICD